MSDLGLESPVVDNVGVTDPAAGGGVDPALAPPPDSDGLDHSRVCAKVYKRTGPCKNFLPAGAPPDQKYCVEHQPKSKRRTMGEPAEGTPPRVKNEIRVDLGKKTKAGPDELAVEEGAKQLLNLIPLVMAMSGDEVCPKAITDAIPAIAAQLGALTKYHPGLKKIFAPAESTGEAVAWLGLVLAVTPAFLAVAAHHKLLPATMLERLAGVIAVAGGAGGD